ncbi:MAG: AraC family transcriptional regulator ligand-binding domain-containing protein [Polaromonas sp.]
MTTPFVVGAISAEVTQKVTHRLDFLLNRSSCGAAPGKSDRPAGRATSLLSFTNMLETAAEQSGLSQLGLELAQIDNERKPGSVRRLFTLAPTVGQAMDDVIRFFPAIQTGTLVRLVKEGAAARFVYSIQDPSVSGELQDAAYTLGMLCRTLRWSAGDAWRLDRVTLTMPAPQSSQAYAQLFQAPVAFNAHATALCFPASVLNIPIRTANPDLYARMCDDMTRMMPDRGDLSLWEDALRAWMRKSFHKFDPVSLERAASDFGITPRTMQRRFHGLGINFLDLRAQVRIQMARQLLAESSLSVSRIAEQLGFSETSAFTRAFRSDARQSPRAFRQACAVSA